MSLKIVPEKQSKQALRQAKEDEEFVQRNLIKGAGALGLLFVVSVIIGIYFETHINELAKYFVENTKPWAVALFIYINDFIISPIPPDLLLVLLAKSPDYPNPTLLSFVFGIASTLAGYSGWLAGRYFFKPHWFGQTFTDFLKNNHGRINRLGKWMVALGALTPLPYSMTCWAAGFLKMDFSKFFWLASLRVFRFYLYFKVLQLSDWVSQLF